MEGIIASFMEASLASTLSHANPEHAEQGPCKPPWKLMSTGLLNTSCFCREVWVEELGAAGICNGCLPPYSSLPCDYMFVCLTFSSSKQGHHDSVCPGDGVGVEHRTRQALHVALFGERPAAGWVPHQRGRLRPAVSFAELSLLFLLSGTQTALLVCLSSCPPNFVPCMDSVLCERNCYLKPI